MKNKQVNIKKTQEFNSASIILPASKSESNRALIIQALSPNKTNIQNLSQSSDTQILLDTLSSKSDTIDVKDAGTAMRFLCAYYAITAKNITLKGTDRMHHRPIEPLVDALRSLGAKVEYLKTEGFPPLAFHGFENQEISSLMIPSDISSQFISALLMIGPVLPLGITLYLEKELVSLPYIELTVSMMRKAGAAIDFQNDKISVKASPYQQTNFEIGSDWTASSYWYAMVTITNTPLDLIGLDPNSMQGDKIIMEFMKPLGVTTELTGSGLKLIPAPFKENVSFDFTHCPDLAQPIMVVCALKGIFGEFKGLERLTIKETDRIKAMQNELAKLGARLEEGQNHKWILKPSPSLAPDKALHFNSYNDHRMAMALAPVCFFTDISIKDPDVVQKSYPGFWDDLKQLGISLNFV